MSNFAKSVLIVLVRVLRTLLDDAGDMKLSQLISQLDDIVKEDGRPWGSLLLRVVGSPRRDRRGGGHDALPARATTGPRWAVSSADRAEAAKRNNRRERVPGVLSGPGKR